MALNKIPKTAHFAIVTETTVHIEGDERSRTNPGHGYPEHTETYINYESFTDKDAWLAKIKSYENAQYSRKEYLAMEVKPVKVTTEIKVDVS